MHFLMFVDMLGGGSAHSSRTQWLRSNNMSLHSDAILDGFSWINDSDEPSVIEKIIRIYSQMCFKTYTDILRVLKLFCHSTASGMFVFNYYHCKYFQYLAWEMFGIKVDRQVLPWCWVIHQAAWSSRSRSIWRCSSRLALLVSLLPLSRFATTTWIHHARLDI